MIAIKPTQLRDNFKNYCNKVVEGETIIVSRPNNENVVMISENEYNEIVKTANNCHYVSMLEQSMKEIEKGGFINKTIDELIKGE